MIADRSEPSCPGCGIVMRFVGSVPQLGELSELQTFRCRQCGLTVSGEAAAEVLEMIAWTVPAWAAVASTRKPADFGQGQQPSLEIELSAGDCVIVANYSTIEAVATEAFAAR